MKVDDERIEAWNEATAVDAVSGVVATVRMLLLQLLMLHSLTLSPSSSSVFSDAALPLRNNKRTIMDMKETRRQRETK